MHEVRAALPPECVSEAVRLANSVGIERVTVTEAFVHGLEVEVRVISVETSTPKARAFIEEFLGSPVLSKVRATLSSRELRAVVSDSPPTGSDCGVGSLHGAGAGALVGPERAQGAARRRGVSVGAGPMQRP